MLMRVQRRAFETHVETHGTADSSFGFVLHAAGTFEPVVAVIVCVNKRNAEFLGEPNVLVFAQFVFLLRMDIGVVEENGEVDARRLHGLHDFSRAWRTAGMQQYLVLPIG